MNELTIRILRVTDMATTFEASDGEYVITGTCGAGSPAQQALQLVIRNAANMLACKRSEEMLKRFMNTNHNDIYRPEWGKS